MEVFNKSCPHCAAIVPGDAQRCRCGRAFDINDRAGTPTLAQEELFESYLAARLQQALLDLDTARAALAAAPQDADKAYALLWQVQQLHQQRDELDAQQEKVAVLRRQAPADTAPASTEFRAAQAARAAQVLASGRCPTQCPACGIAWEPSSSRCACGLNIVAALIDIDVALTDPQRK